MFSYRSTWHDSPNSLTRLLAEKRGRGERILDLTNSNPTRCRIPYPSDVLLETLRSSQSLEYTPAPLGLLTARQAIAGYYASRSLRVSPENILLTSGTSEAYSHLIHVLCDPGDNILVPRPCYPLLEYIGQLAGVELRPYSLIYDGEWHLDAESMRTAIDPKTRAIVLIHPNNPTGSYISEHEKSTVLEAARTYRLALIVDEVFYEYPLIEGAVHGHVADPTDNVPCYLLNGVSKLLGLPQLKLSWIAALGPSSSIRDALGRLEIVADTYLSVNSSLQIALPDLLRRGAPVREAIRGRLRANASLLGSKLSSHTGASVLRVEGGWSAVVGLPRTIDDASWALHFLSEHGVLVHPGYYFDFASGSFVVLSLLTDPETFREGLAGIKASLPG